MPPVVTDANIAHAITDFVVRSEYPSHDALLTARLVNGDGSGSDSGSGSGTGTGRVLDVVLREVRSAEDGLKVCILIWGWDW